MRSVRLIGAFGLMSRKRRFALLALIWTGVSLPSVVLSADTLAESHARAIEMARAGALDESLDLISDLRSADPGNLQLRYDEIVVLGWADRDQEVIDAAAQIETTSTPSYVLHSVAKSSRNLGNFDSAAEWYTVLLTRSEHDIDARIGLAMVYADSGRFSDARQVLSTHPDLEENRVRLRLAEGYILERQGRFTEALACYQDVIEDEPGNRSALRAMVLLLRSILLPREALELALQYPGIASDDEIIQLEADIAALGIRFGAVSSYPATQKFAGTDSALSDLDQLLSRGDLSPEVRRRLEYDRVVALTDRLRASEAITEFETNLAQTDDLPTYVLVAIGRAYLFERKPEQARYYLEKALEREPGNLGIQFRLFYVYADLQEHELALELAQTLEQTLPPVRRIPDTSIVRGTEEYLVATSMVGLAQAYADQLAESQQHFEHLSEALPHNTDIRQELANVYRWRGWIDRALFEYAQVIAVEPGLLSARVGQAHTMLDNHDLASVEQEIQDLKEQFPFEPAVTGLEKRWIDHNRQELTVETSFGQSSGATFGEDQYQIDATWYSRPLGYRYRAFVASHNAFAEFPEGEGSRERIGAGVEYRYKRWLSALQLSGDVGGGELGLRGSIDYRINDYVEVGGRLETHSNSMPLRGERAGITNDLLGLNAAFSRHESAAVEVGLTIQDFTDGNKSRSLYVNGRQRVINTPRYKLSILGDIYDSRSDKDDVAYFSPRRSFSWSVGASNDWLMYRRYDFGLSHNLTGRLGQVDQSGFGADSTWSLEYRFFADFDTRWGAFIGINRSSNVYDGAREYATFFHGGLRGRF
jgi:biofilm PGA synthesis protein PgaA